MSAITTYNGLSGAGVTAEIAAAIAARPNKANVRAATTGALAALTATTQTLTANANGALAAQDGITLVAGDRLLVKNQAAPAQNGLYTVTTAGTAGTPFVLTRTSDANTWDELAGAIVLVMVGSTLADHVFKCTSDAGGTLGTTAVTWVDFTTGFLTSANNLSDVASAATAFANIKQAASDTATGVIEIATDAETVTGTDTTRAVTPSSLTARLGAPGTIGGDTPAPATFTTLNATGGTLTGMALAGSFSGTLGSSIAFDDAAAFRTAAGLEIGAAVQAYNAGLAAFALAWTGASGKVFYTSAPGVISEGTITGAALTFLGSLAGALAVSSGKTLTASNTLTFTGTDGSSVAFGAGGTVVYLTTAQTLTVKRIQKRVTSAASASSITPDISTTDIVEYTALAANLAINAISGTPVNGEMMEFIIKDNASSRTLTWDSSIVSCGGTLPTATTVSKVHTVLLQYSAGRTRWECKSAIVET